MPRVRWGAVPDAPDFCPDAVWRALREPSPLTVQLLAAPVGVLGVSLLGLGWLALVPVQAIWVPGSVPGLTGSVLVLVLLHEGVHLVAHPGAGRSAQSTLGFWPRYCVPYTHYTGEVSRTRLLVMLLAPLVAVSVLPFGLAAITPALAPWAAASLTNVLLCSADLLNVGLLLTQVPADGRVRNRGARTYWRRPASSPTSAQTAAPP
jgi:hypothetical protein